MLNSISTYKIPIKFESKLISLYRNQNPTHDQNCEKSDSIISNLNRTGLSNNPFYNKERIETSHGRNLNNETLYKLGQISLDEVKNKNSGSFKENFSIQHAKKKTVNLDYLFQQNQSLSQSPTKMGEQDYYFKKLRPWQHFLDKKKKQLRRELAKYKDQDLSELQQDNQYLQNLMSFDKDSKQDISSLDNPADQCMLKVLFKQDDNTMKFYEKKYRFQMKDLRPFAQHTNIKELSPLHNENIFDQEMKLFLEQDRVEKQLQKQRYRQIQRSMNHQFLKYQKNYKNQKYLFLLV